MLDYLTERFQEGESKTEETLHDKKEQRWEYEKRATEMQQKPMKMFSQTKKGKELEGVKENCA